MKDKPSLYKGVFSKLFTDNLYYENYTNEDYEWKKETGRCRFCGNLVEECVCACACDTDFITWKMS